MSAGAAGPRIPLVGYADRLSVAPGETIAFQVSSALPGPYRARLVRVVCGDPNPAGPGIKEREVAADFAGTYPSRLQPVHLGSCAIVDASGVAAALGAETGLAVSATIWPTLPGEPGQSVVSWLEPGARPAAGLALVLDGERGMTAVVGTPDGPVSVAVGKRLRTRAWYRVWAAVDAAGSVTVGQAPLRPEHGVDDAGEQSRAVPGAAASSRGPVTIAARAGGHPAAGELTGHFNGKIERPRIAPPGGDGPVRAEWDFAREISSQRIVDVGPRGLDGRLVNLPARAMTGSAWTGGEHCWRHLPEHYGAIHFHDDDLYDCGWETDFRFTVPAGFPSGAYAVRLEAEDGGAAGAAAASEMLPFYVRPPRRPAPGAARPAICVLAPTFTYVVYGNHARGVADAAYRERAAAWGARPWNPDQHPQFGLSTYNFHRDGSGVAYASRLRPVITMRSGFLSWLDPRGSGLRHYPADTHLLDWLDHEGHDFDVVTDEDLDAEGVELIAPYRVVLTTSHPEYHTAATLDALEAFRDGGGRLMYLGGNGFYWRVARHPDVPGAIEVRRAEGGIRAWAAEPGEYYHAFDGCYGGLWRRNGRPPQRLVGIGFTAQGMFEGTGYERAPGADDPRAAWILEGVGERRFGDFGLSGGGAAGFELDRLDHRLGSPAGAVVVARSVDHPGHFVLVPEEQLTHVTTWPGEPAADLIRADMVYFETAGGGAVFAVGSITFCGSLAHDGYDNAIARIVANVLERFSR